MGKNRMMRRFVGVCLTFMALHETLHSTPVVGPSDRPHQSCQHHLDLLGITRIVPSGRDSPEVLQFLEKRTLDSAAAARKIGMKVLPHIMEIVPAGQLMVLASLGRQAIPSWKDGMALLNPYGAAGTMEFVTPQCPVCRSFYSASTRPIQQGSIIDHVHGHNDYSANSSVFASLQVDVIEESLQFAEYLRNLYINYDHDIVSQFLQWLYSFSNLQDLARNTYDSPESFDPKNRPGVLNLPPPINHAQRHLDGKMPYDDGLHPRSPTPSILQFMVTNLPPDAPEWQRETIRRFEKIVRIYVYYTSDKFINEGWATLSMEMLPGHTDEYGADEHMFEYMNLLQGVAGRASLTNPYWLGREAIRRERAKFEKWFESVRRSAFEKEVAEKSVGGLEKTRLWAVERDRAFVDHFHTNYIRSLPDYDILQKILDDDWVREQGLFLYRKAKHDEQDPNLPPPSSPGPVEQKIITSTDAKKVVREIARRVSDRRFQMPRILLEDSNAFGRNVFHQRHEMVREDGWLAYGKPLELWGTAQTLYLQARVMKKTVSLETVLVQSSMQVRDLPVIWFGQFVGLRPQSVDSIKSTRIRIEVDPRGRVLVFQVPGWVLDLTSEDTLQDVENMTPWDITKEVPFLDVQKKLQSAVDAYLFDQQISVNADLRDRDRQNWLTGVVDGIINAGVGGQFNLISHTPTAPDAILEYRLMLNRRLYESLQWALNGKLKSKQTQTGLRFRVMPIVPEIAFDEEMTEQISDAARQDPVDPAYFLDPLRRMVEAPTREEHFQAEREIEQIVLKENRHREFWNAYKRGDAVIEGPHVKEQFIRISGQEALGSDGRPRKKGDKVWGPSKPRKQGGKTGNDEGPGRPGEPGDEPADGKDPGDDSQDPSEIEIPFDILSEFIGAQIELPFLKPKTGDLEAKDTIRDGGVKKPTGDPLWTRMMGNVLAVGRMMAKKRGLDVTKMSRYGILREGMRTISPPDYIVPDRIVDPSPDTNAVVLFVVDQSGSMLGWPIERAKQFVFNTKMAIQSKYKQTKFGFVSFDTKGHVYYNESDFWKSWQGGGTDYSEGFRVGQDELKKFNPNSWDRYLIGVGDSGTSKEQESANVFEQIVQEIEYAAYVHVEEGWGFDWAFPKMVQEFGKSYKNVGYAVLTHDPASPLKALLDLFGKDRQKK